MEIWFILIFLNNSHIYTYNFFGNPILKIYMNCFSFWKLFLYLIHNKINLNLFYNELFLYLKPILVSFKYEISNSKKNNVAHFGSVCNFERF